MELASSYLTRLGPKGMVTVTVTNKRRKSEASSLNSLNRVLDWYYEEQAEMNYCASLLQTPISIEHVWGEEKRKRKAQAEITPVSLQLSESIKQVWDYYRDSGMPLAALGMRPLSPPRRAQLSRQEKAGAVLSVHELSNRPDD